MTMSELEDEGMKWQMEQESILKNIKDKTKLITKSKKTKSSKKNKNLKDDTTNSTKIRLKLYRYDENGEPIYISD